jgi:hypothetical protein
VYVHDVRIVVVAQQSLVLRGAALIGGWVRVHAWSVRRVVAENFAFDAVCG